jgi:7-carboxy-7-deazaguanine synthase
MDSDISRASSEADLALSLRITEIFLSLQGEASSVGFPTVFVRTTGCPLRCVYCDTAYAFTGGETLAMASIIDQVEGFGVRHVTVTGGEPLAQAASLTLMKLLCDVGFSVSLETSGAVDVGPVDPRVTKVVDIKTPGSGECSRNLFTNLSHLSAPDQVKFVIADRADYEWSRNLIGERDIAAEILFSPSHDVLSARTLADWIIEDRLPVRFQIQLHKYLWGDEPGR